MQNRQLQSFGPVQNTCISARDNGTGFETCLPSQVTGVNVETNGGGEGRRQLDLFFSVDEHTSNRIRKAASANPLTLVKVRRIANTLN